MKSSQSARNIEEHAPNTNVQKQLRGLIWTCAILLLLVGMAAVYFIWMMIQNVHKNVDFLDRSEWVGEPPNGTKQLQTPISSVIILHTATECCESEDVCKYRTRMIQNFHMNSFRFTDIAYNFLVGGDGQVYVGRGWDAQGQHVKGYGGVSVSIAFIGTFGLMAPPERQVRAAKRLLKEGVRLHKLQPDYHIYAHRQLSATESPGQKLYELMQHWPHWTEDVTTLRRLNNEPLKLVARVAWLAQPPLHELDPLSVPVKNVRFESTSSKPCSTQAECTFYVRYRQTFDIESLNQSDINYNFLVGSDSNVYVGRGWDSACATALTDEPQLDEIIVGFIGQSRPTASQRNITQLLLTEGVRLGKISADYNLIDALR